MHRRIDVPCQGVGVIAAHAPGSGSVSDEEAILLERHIPDSVFTLPVSFILSQVVSLVCLSQGCVVICLRFKAVPCQQESELHLHALVHKESKGYEQDGAQAGFVRSRGDTTQYRLHCLVEFAHACHHPFGDVARERPHEASTQFAPTPRRNTPAMTR